MRPIAIAHKLDMTLEAIYRILHKNNIMIKLTDKKRLKRNHEIKEMYKHGIYSMEDIAKKFSLSSVMIYNILKNKKAPYDKENYWRNRERRKIRHNIIKQL